VQAQALLSRTVQLSAQEHARRLLALVQGISEEGDGRLLNADFNARYSAASTAPEPSRAAAENRSLQVLTVKSARAGGGNAAYVPKTEET
jgi:hypothetical protein